MAEMIPDRLPSRASAGEKKLFSVLQKLPDDYIVYYEPIVEDRYPDFIIICPDLGLLVLEVKGWYPKDILAGDNNSVRVKESRGEVRRNHPIRQAWDYMLSLMNQCENHYYGKCLLQSKGEYQGRFIFPFGHFAVLSNITTTQLQQHHLGDLTHVFPSTKVVPRNVLESWTEESFSEESLCQILKSFFDPFWTFPRLTESQIKAIRAIIHPEIVLPSSQTEPETPEVEPLKTLEIKLPIMPDEKLRPTIGIKLSQTLKVELPDIKVLDLRQENNARNIGDGHRIIYGVAGSGKTVLLIAKARLLSVQKPEAQILLLCYNVTLATYLREATSECQNVTVKHFDGWAKANSCTRQQGEPNEELGERFLKILEQGCSDTRRYDTILIDEAQDFADSWYKCVLEAMVEPNDGDLIIVGDGNQSLYRKTKVPWSHIGINAKGRTIYKKFDLDKNYRNSREIVELATLFSTPTEQSEQTENAILSLFVDPEKCQRRTGIKPALVKSENRRTECTTIFGIVKNLLDGKWFGKDIKPLKPEEISIFYPIATYREKPILQGMIESLSDLASVIWLNDPSNFRAKTRINEPGIKIQTIHSAKGLQYRAVILMWADHLPRQFDDTTEAQERCLMYIGITRPEDYLVISASGQSPFITEIENSEKVVVV
ncbi:nuclease-related domain-containing DEAD/DEAH box helicase [Iningainema tapete]|uniref:AAA family ATPase n=1 Tax=Iningainema tapete BLCC-T55 TaxID=2748662 RepID=A0A8J6XII0_9CYAN|nr:nuclease-related domain-containing DEAD/DEAH box helicase [Iningainema tapete]MBD2772009.1 AAA family ATPase [Iningainema tapete BLCC-T55]